jgi:hypothetical protein
MCQTSPSDSRINKERYESGLDSRERRHRGVYPKKGKERAREGERGRERERVREREEEEEERVRDGKGVESESWCKRIYSCEEAMYVRRLVPSFRKLVLSLARNLVAVRKLDIKFIRIQNRKLHQDMQIKQIWQQWAMARASFRAPRNRYLLTLSCPHALLNNVASRAGQATYRIPLHAPLIKERERERERERDE